MRALTPHRRSVPPSRTGTQTAMLSRARWRVAQLGALDLVFPPRDGRANRPSRAFLLHNIRNLTDAFDTTDPYTEGTSSDALPVRALTPHRRSVPAVPHQGPGCYAVAGAVASGTAGDTSRFLFPPGDGRAIRPSRARSGTRHPPPTMIGVFAVPIA